MKIFTDKESQDFVGKDMALKFLQMWYTRSKRYRNHKARNTESQYRQSIKEKVDRMEKKD